MHRQLHDRCIEPQNFCSKVHHLRDRLTNGGQFIGRPASDGDVVKSDHGNIFRHSQLRRADGVDAADRHHVTGEKYAVGHYSTADEPTGCIVSGLIAEAAADLMSVQLDAELLQLRRKPAGAIEVGGD